MLFFGIELVIRGWFRVFFINIVNIGEVENEFSEKKMMLNIFYLNKG